MVQTYWQIGRLIVEDEQGGSVRAAYGQRVLPDLAKRLTAEFGKGFSAPSLWSYRQFHLEFPILSTVWRELSWSHLRMLLRVKDVQARSWYANEAVSQGWICAPSAMPPLPSIRCWPTTPSCLPVNTSC